MNSCGDLTGGFPYAAIDDVIDRALREDLGLGDATTDALIPSELLGAANLVARSPGVLAGVQVACEVFRRVATSIEGWALIFARMSTRTCMTWASE